jgi:hypothetical protein
MGHPTLVKIQENQDLLPKASKRDLWGSRIHDDALKSVMTHIFSVIETTRSRVFNPEPQCGEDSHNGALMSAFFKDVYLLLLHL